MKDDKCRGCEMSLNTCPSCEIVYCDKCKEYVKTGEHTSDMGKCLHFKLVVTMQVNCMHVLVASGTWRKLVCLLSNHMTH